MAEIEKMLSGQLYNPNVHSLMDARLKAKSLCYEYNNLKPTEIEEKKEIIINLFGKVSGNFLIEPTFFCDYGFNIEIGKNFYSNHNLIILDPAKVVFGDNVLIGPNCGFYTAEHPISYEERNKGFEFAKSIKVGNNVWFGGNVTVIGGVTIGDNVIIGAGSVVVKDLPSNVLAVGNPCKVIREI